MKRIDFIKTLGILAGSGMIIPEIKSEKLVLPAKNSNADMTFYTGYVERIRITSSGNVSIGTTTPSTRLVIS
jgi:hypothetical protein